MEDHGWEDRATALQQSIRSRIDVISADPLLSNGGRILNILDPEAFGWDNVRREVDRFGMVGLTMVDRDTTFARLERDYGGNADFPFWEVFTGTPEEVVPACKAVLAEGKLVDGWRLSHHARPDDSTLEAVRALNVASGVAPYPAYYLRSELFPSLLSCLWTEDGRLAGCASAQMRYHPEGLLAGWLFAGGVSVSPGQRRRGMGSLVNAALLIESHRRFGWSHVLEQAKGDNAPSAGMIRRCGLTVLPGKVTIVVNMARGYFTR